MDSPLLVAKMARSQLPLKKSEGLLRVGRHRDTYPKLCSCFSTWENRKIGFFLSVSPHGVLAVGYGIESGTDRTALGALSGMEAWSAKSGSIYLFRGFVVSTGCHHGTVRSFDPHTGLVDQASGVHKHRYAEVVHGACHALRILATAGADGNSRWSPAG